MHVLQISRTQYNKDYYGEILFFERRTTFAFALDTFLQHKKGEKLLEQRPPELETQSTALLQSVRLYVYVSRTTNKGMTFVREGDMGGVYWRFEHCYTL